MKILNKKYIDLIALVKSVNLRKETLELLYQVERFNKN